MIWTLSFQSALYRIITSEAQTLVHFTLRPVVFHIWGCWKLKVYWMTSDWPWTLNCQKYPVYTEYLPPRPKFSSVLLYNPLFSRYKAVENQKCTNWPWTDLSKVPVPCMHWVLSARPIFGLMYSTTKIQYCRQLKIHRMTSDWPWICNWQGTVYTQISLHFALWWLLFKRIAVL